MVGSRRVLALRDVVFGYDKPFLHVPELRVEEGSFYAVVGPNGAGKTTLMKLMAGIYKPWEGEVSIDGEPLRYEDRKWIAKKVAIVSQSVDWNLSLSVYEIVSMGRYPHGEKEIRSEVGAEVVYDAMVSVNVEKFMDRAFSELSGGEAQRALIARALAQQPEFLLLDEPISHLDIYHQVAVLELCKRIVKNGMTVVAVLHDLNMAGWFADVIILLQDGKIRSVGDVISVLNAELIEEVFGVSMLGYRVDGRTSVLIPKSALKNES